MKLIWQYLKAIPLSNEFLEYESIVIAADLDILKQFWKLNEKKFPLLSRVAKRFMCAQATSTPSERLFSAAGYNIWDRRCSLKPSKVNKMMVLHQPCQAKTIILDSIIFLIKIYLNKIIISFYELIQNYLNKLSFK